MKHTEGPWQHLDGAIKDIAGYDLARVYHHHGLRTIEETNANGNLMAAAPEFAEVLKVLVSVKRAGVGKELRERAQAILDKAGATR